MKITHEEEVPDEKVLECGRCGHQFDARQTPPNQPCPDCEGKLEYIHHKGGKR